MIAAFVAVVVSMIASVLLGLAQRATGLDTSLYPYGITNSGYAVGFFANGNHLATLCALSLPAAAALVAAMRRPRRARWLILVAVISFARSASPSARRWPASCWRWSPCRPATVSFGSVVPAARRRRAWRWRSA